MQETQEKKDFQMQRLSRQSQADLPCISAVSPSQLTINEAAQCYEISQYNDSPMNATDGTVVVKKLSTAFPSQSRDFFLLLVERMIANGFTAQRCRDAVNHLIDNFAYKQINIADVIRFDRKRKVYDYQQMVRKLACNGGPYPDTDSFSKVKIGDKTYYYLESENL